jgi:hypothetical protein
MNDKQQPLDRYALVETVDHFATVETADTESQQRS